MLGGLGVDLKNLKLEQLCVRGQGLISFQGGLKEGIEVCIEGVEL